MARVDNLENFLTDVAGAIREKKGTQDQIPAGNFDTEILALPSQGKYQEKTVTITHNGQTTLTPDTGYDAMDQVEITVKVPTDIDTSDATATALDILNPKTAYVKDQKVTGAMIPTTSVSGLSQYDPLVVLKTSQNNQYDAFEYLGILAITTRYNNNVSISLYNKEDLSEISTYTFDRTTYFGNGTYLVTNIVEATNEYFEMSIGMGYGNGDGKTLYTFKKVRYTYETNSWLIYGTIGYSHEEFFNNSGQTSGLRADGKPNVYYLCNDRDPGGSNTCINIVYLNWGKGDVSGSYTEVHRDSVQGRNHSWIETTGDGSWIRMTGCLVKADVNGRTLNSWGVNNVYFSHNMKYMVQGTNIYKITPGNNYNTINSNKELFSTLPSYDKVFFSIDDYYLLHYYGGVLSVYQIENNGLTRVQQISLPNCRIKEIFNNTLILAYNTSTYSIGILKCNTGGVTIEKIERNGQIFQYVHGSNIPNTSEVLNGKPFYGIDSVLYGTMPNNGELNYTPSTEEQTIPEGYTSGGTIAAYPVTEEEYNTCLGLTNQIIGNGGN